MFNMDTIYRSYFFISKQKIHRPILINLTHFLDGCHIEVHPHTEDAVDYFNFKGWYSVILFALVDYRYVDM